MYIKYILGNNIYILFFSLRQKLQTDDRRKFGVVRGKGTRGCKPVRSFFLDNEEGDRGYSSCVVCLEPVVHPRKWGRNREVTLFQIRLEEKMREFSKHLDKPSERARGVFRSNTLIIYRRIGEPHIHRNSSQRYTLRLSPQIPTSLR